MTLSKYVSETEELTSEKVISECLAVIKSLHPNYSDDRPELTLRLWHRKLNGFHPNVVKQATYEVAANSKYVPKLADVLTEIEAMITKHEELEQLRISAHSEIDECDKWWLSLTDEEMEESHQRQLDWIEGKDVELNEQEKERAILFRDVTQMIEEEKKIAQQRNTRG